jgi:hypothetical protein
MESRGIGLGERLASRLGHFTAKEKDPCNNWIEGWVDPGVGLDAVAKRKIPFPPLLRNEPQSSSPESNHY